MEDVKKNQNGRRPKKFKTEGDPKKLQWKLTKKNHKGRRPINSQNRRQPLFFTKNPKNGRRLKKKKMEKKIKVEDDQKN